MKYSISDNCHAWKSTANCYLRAPGIPVLRRSGTETKPPPWHSIWVLTRDKPQLDAGRLKARLFFSICHSWGKTQASGPQAGLDLVCVLYFSPQDLTWTQLLTSLVALLEAGKFYNSPFKLTMLGRTFTVRGLFDPMCSAQLQPELENICSRSPRGFHAGGFFFSPLCGAQTQTLLHVLSLVERRTPLGWGVPRCPAEPVLM